MTIEKCETNIDADVVAIRSIDTIDKLLEVVCRSTGMGFAAIIRIKEAKCIACAVRDEIGLGILPGVEIKLETTLCNEIRQHKIPIIVDEAEKDEVYGFQSYVSIPVTTKDGQFFGALWAMDLHPTAVHKPEIINMCVLFADLITFHLHALEELAAKESQLIEAKKTSELRDKYIAILGHDVRNPVGAILNVSELLLRMPVEDRVKKMARIVQTSTQRMRGLIENILDFARGHLGEGIKLYLSDEMHLEEMLLQVVEEQRLVSPDYNIETNFTLEQVFNCDGKRLAQLLFNLLINALRHGEHGAPVHVAVTSKDNEFLISVTNRGVKIDEDIKSRLFQPFYKGDIEPANRGVGLGLYLASEIAKAHKGTLQVESNDEHTCFMFKMGI